MQAPSDEVTGQVAPSVVPLSVLDRRALAIAGGKAANLGEMLRAGLPVPPGFCVTTGAYARVAQSASIGPLLDELAGIPPSDTRRLAEVGGQIRQRLLGVPVPDDLSSAILESLRTLGPSTPVAVRSSATAEDLPSASFAGQQDTYLNVIEPDAVLEAVRRCWASLWTDRAVAYRATHRVDQHAVRLAVVVQRMIASQVAGVLFTANPLTGRRGQALIDASPGLGEAVVSGAVNPDHFVVDTGTGVVLERQVGDKRLTILPADAGGTRRVEATGATSAPCLSDDQLRDLARLGARAESLFGAPQDTEFAIGADGTLWLTQARPITTLFPLPDNAPHDQNDLRVYFNMNVFQGVFRPFTPMGVQAFRLLGSSLAGLFGAAPAVPETGPSVLGVAAGRILIDVTTLVRSPLGRRVCLAALSVGEARTGPLLRLALEDPRLSPKPVSRWQVMRAFSGFAARTGFLTNLVRTLLAPGAALSDIDRVRAELERSGNLPSSASARERLDEAARLIVKLPPRLFPRVIPLVVVGIGSFRLAWRLLGDLASADERDAVMRGLPHNPTTEMDLALWDLADRVRADGTSAHALRTRTPAELARAYRNTELPTVLQRELGTFLAHYGHRAIAEIDLGMPRWADDPAHLLGTLANYLQLDQSGTAPDAQFRAVAAQAEATADELAQRARRKNPLRGGIVRFLLRRGRILAGMREMPKFLIVLLLSRVRALLLGVGEELILAGRLDSSDDIFFLSLPEARMALDGADPRALVRERRADYEEELHRRRLPRLLLSDGTDPEAALPASLTDADTLRGTPASAGQVTGHARVILDPVGAHLEPGEILVAPSTDPGWTPLFLTAGGLVMEMGGAISHGAVVAREYGIPAVVGVPGATERIVDGQEVLVDGTAGVVVLK